MLTRSEYQAALYEMLIPASIVGTRETAEGPPDSWMRGPLRDLNHDHYLILTRDPLKVNSPGIRISFDTSVDFRGRLLSDPEFYHDALTKRILCVELLNHNASVRQASAAYAYDILQTFDWALRWRNARNIKCFTEVTESQYEEFRALSRSTPDICNFLPVGERLHMLAEDENYKVALYRSGNFYHLRWDKLAVLLGTNHGALSRSHDFRNVLEKLLPTLLARIGVSRDQLKLKKQQPPALNRVKPDQRLGAWDAIDRLSAGGFLPHDELQFRVPGISRLASGKNTPTLLPHDMMRIFILAARWVVVYRHHIIRTIRRRASAVPKQNYQYNRPALVALANAINSQRPEGFFPLDLNGSAHPFVDGRMTLSRAVKHLFVACAVLTGGLGARRRGEVKSLREGCLRTSPDGLILDIYILKTLKDVDGVPVPEIMREVVTCLEELSNEARSVSGKKFLFAFLAEFEDGQILDTSADFKYLTNFLSDCELAPPAGQSSWTFSFHMLRKGFVVAYYHGNLRGSFDGTGRMLRHYSTDMTRIYMDDEEIGALSWLRVEVMRLSKIALAELSHSDAVFLAEAKIAVQDFNGRRVDWNKGRQEFFVSKFMDTYDGNERPVGHGAVRILDQLAAMTVKARNRVLFSGVPTNSPDGMRKSVLSQVTEAAIDHFMEPIPGGFGYCMFRRQSNEDALLANCIKEREAGRSPWQRHIDTGVDTRPDYAFSGLHPCLSCKLCAVFNENSDTLEQILEETEAQQSKAATPGLEASVKELVDDIHNLIEEAKRVVDGKQRPN